MRIVYFDCSAGISGDMCLGALVDAGVPLKEIERGLRALPVKEYKLEARKVKRASIAATKVDVIVQQSKAGSQNSEAKHWKDIEKIIKTSSFSAGIKQKGLKIFRSLFEAEGMVHGKAYHSTHLHELGAMDCLVDVFGTLVGLEYLEVEKIYSSPVNLGKGHVITEHGMLPVPAPATAELLKGVPVYSSDIPFELTTPTGAAIVRGVAGGFLDMPLMRVENTGYGAGQKDIKGLPNILRLFLGEELLHPGAGHLPKVTVIETNIDDMNPQLYEYVMERLFGSGALDVFLTQVIMKKGRPGILLTVLCHGEKRADLIDILLSETTTIGVRFYESSRIVLERKGKEEKTAFGKVRLKESKMLNGAVKVSPEYEDCKRIARKSKISLLEVMKRFNTLRGKF